MLGQGIILMISGMTIVFVFLLLMIFMIKLTGAILRKLSSRRVAVTIGELKSEVDKGD